MNEEEIKVGDYIRTNSGTIAKLKRIEFDKVDEGLKWYFYDKKEFGVNIIKEWCTNKPYIVKYSPEITDLLEEGDYVNGEKITEITKDLFIKNQINLWTGIYELNSFGDRSMKKITNNDIKSIVTKEQFEQMKYNVGDD